MRNTIIQTRPRTRTHTVSFNASNSRILLAALVCLCGAASAQESRNVFEEIVVTAQKREQSIQDVGIAMTALTGDQLATLGVEGSTDLAQMTPGVFLGGNIGGQTSVFTIRGVTQNDFADWVEAPVAVYIDEAYIAMVQGQSFSTFDLDRVEVAKGPQGTLFGRNATGGLIHYITRKPTREFDAYADLTAAQYDQYRVEAALSGPLSDGLAGRLSLLYNTYDNILHNKYPEGLVGPPVAGQGQDEWNDETTAVRGQLSFDATDNVNVLLSVNYAKTNTSTGPYQSSPTVAVFDEQGRIINTINAAPNETREAIGPGGVAIDIPAVDGDFDGLRPTPGGNLFGYVDSDGEGFGVSKNLAYSDLNEFKTSGAGLKLTWETRPNLSFTSLSDYKHYEKFVNMDIDASPYAQSMYLGQADVDTFTQEIRLNGSTDRIHWVTGFYYLKIRNKSNNGLGFEATSPFSSPLIFGVPVDAIGHIKLDTDSYSLFGQLDYALTNRWTLVAGARAIREEKDYSFSQFAYLNEDDRYIDTAVQLFPLDQPFAENTSDDLWAGRLQLEFRPSDGLLLYAGINRGVKAGSFNAQLADGSPRLAREDIGYDPETLLSYEVGFKSTFMDGRARLNGATYFYKYDDYQAFLFVQSSGTVTNLNAENKGVELDFAVSPVDGFDFTIGMSYLDAKVKDLQLASGNPLVEPLFKDVEPTFAPPLQIAAMLRYAWPALGGEISAQVSGSFTDSFFYNLRNFDSEKYDSYALANLRFSYAPEGGKWEVAAFVKNVSDERYRTVGYNLATLCGCSEDAYGQPRWAGVTFKIKSD